MANKVSEKQKETKPADQLLVKGKVTIWQGEGRDRKVIVREAENHWVDAGLRGLVSALVCSRENQNIYPWAAGVQMYLGSDTAAPTTHGMTALTTPIGVAPGTPPNTISGASRTNPETGKWQTSVTAVWNAGTVSGTVGELALYLRAFANITVGWTLTSNPANVMVSRLSSADSDFSGFAIDPSKSLTVEWRISISYA